MREREVVCPRCGARVLINRWGEVMPHGPVTRIGRGGLMHEECPASRRKLA